MAEYMDVPYMHDTNYLNHSDELGPVHTIPTYDPPNGLTDKVIYKPVNVGGANSVYTVYAPCGAEGSAMYDPDSLTRPGPGAIGGRPTNKHCWLMYAPPIIIHGDYMSVKQGFTHVNMVHRTSGYSPPVSTNAGLSTLGVIA